MSIKCVCFDLGRVLIKICPLWKEMLSRIGEHVPSNKEIPESIYDFKPIIAMEKGDISSEEYLKELASTFNLSPEKAYKLHLAMLSSPYAGVTEILKELKLTGTITACLSNTNSIHWDHINQSSEYSFLKHADYLLASHEYGHSKPDLAIYRALEKLTGYQGKEILFFDDVLQNVRGALNAGWEASLINPNEETVPQIRKVLEEKRILNIKE